MNMNKLIVYTIGITLGFILTASLLIPVVQDAQDNTKTYYNNSYGSYAILHDGETHTLEINEAGEYLLDDTKITIGAQEYILMTDTAYLRYSPSAHELYYYTDSGIHHTTSLPMNFTITDGTVSGSAGSTPIEFTFEWCGYANQNGDYKIAPISTSAKTIYFNTLDDIYGVGRSDNEIYSYHGENVKITSFSHSNQEITIDYKASTVIESSTHPVHSMIFKNSTNDVGMEMTVTSDGETRTFVGGNMMCPAKVLGQTDNGASTYAMLGVLPILCILGLAIMATRIFNKNN